jgi:hypothetical protein
VLIGIQLERTQPLAGTAAAKQAQPRRFDGWLELLSVIAELVAAAPVGARIRMRRRSPGIETRPGMPAGCIPKRQRTSSPRRSILGWV